ncbi:hypothetical protein SPRG_03410 [Saprolegnia parasitica CBS 223.65]|uniref:RyR/IP3R Homology associated domain-containing protein n=1 Tax=Saprolegnia parasitica (strain CBS 223.65) TaxID=695850 RepID=A0A067CP00_SAPPC|nr:hypothetical protein SPRG_03410 [Saprolegnia parasitica CBS 223.65]KDO32193.1 hypothetical protein SPRG_03410 [Saprolegnia parasitica CBS 223.65]|eukprot:XP_012197373.1 hypothetical protein SPRG_03410 [Saprolegnia parasitica CBS 223.65]
MRRRRRSANSPKLKSPVEPPMRTKFQMTGLTQVLMEIKDDICATLLLVDALRLDAQISTVLVTLATEPPFHGPRWRRHASKPLSTLARSMFETPSLSCRYSLSELAHRPVDTILLQALMYEHPPLVSKALELLMQQFNQHEQVTKALSNVLLLVNDATVGIYGQLQADVQQLRHFAETTEVWMNLTSTEDFRVATSVTGLLTSFTAHLQSSGIVTEIRERRQTLNIGLPRTAAHPASAHQVEVRRLLRNLNAMQTIFDMLRDGNHFFKSHFPSVLGDASRATSPMAHATSSFSRMQQQTALRPVFVEALRFFFAFGADNSMNVALLAEHTLALLDLVEEIEEAQDVLSLVYGSSESLCKAIPVKVLQHFLDLWRVDLDVHAQTKGRYLHALEAFVSVGDTPVPENQLVVLLELVKPDAGYLQLLGAAPTSFLALLTETKEALTTQRDATVTYHLDVLHLLASCAMGADARLKDLCASILSLDALLSLLHAAAFACVGSLHEYTWLGNVAMALVRFLKEVYLTSEAPSWAQQPQATHDQIVTTLESLLVEYAFAHLCHLQQKDALTPPQAHVVYDGGRIWVDVAAASYKKLATDDPPYESHLLTLLLPALHACLVELSAPASVLISLYETLFSLLSTAVTATTFAQLSPSNQDALLASARVLDKLASAQNDPSALENLAYEASARPKRPHLGQNRVLRSIVLGEASARETLRALYEQLQHPDTSMASPPRASLTARPKDVLHVSRSSPTKGLAPLRQATTPLSPPSPMKSPSQWHSSLARCRQLLMRAPLDGGCTTVLKWKRCSRWSNSWDGAKNAGLVPVVASEDGTVLDAFLSLVKADPETQVARSAELHAMMQRILHLEDALRDEAESISDVPKSSLTFDDVILKLIEHFKLLKHAKYAKMSVDLLDIFCQMIKSLEPSRRHAMQQKLDKLGLTVLVVNIISSTTDRVVFDSSIALGIALLDGMNAKVQEHFYATWTESKTTKFFERLKHRMDSATDEVKTVAQVPALDDLPRPHSMVLRLSHEARSGRSLELADDPPYASIVAIFRFLQLLCEGHYLHVQQYLLSQGSAVSSINLVEATTSFLLEIYPSLNSANVLLFKQLFDTITEFCQGPCPEAQECVANYKFISVVNELLVVTSLPESDARLHMRQLKGAIVVCLLSLIEGRTDDIIHDRLVTELNFDTIKDNVVDVHRYFQETYHGVYDGNTACSTDAFLALGFNVHILIQHLMEYQPRAELQSPHVRGVHALAQSDSERRVRVGLATKDAAYAVAYAFFDAKCARVELVWHLRGDPHLVQIYFPVHPICCCVTQRSKDRLKTHMPLDPSSKLSAFFAHTSNLLHEMEYQSQLQQQFLLAWLLRQTHRLQVLSFVLALLINLLVVTTLRADASTSQPYSAWQQGATRDGPGIDALLTVLGSIQVALCTTVFVLYAVHTVPLLITEGWHAEKRKLKNTIGGASTPYARSDVDATESLQDVEDLLRLLGDRDEDVLRTKQDRVRNIVVSVRFLLRDPRLVYYGLLVMIPVLGTYVHVQFFAFHVLDIINRSQELKNVLKAVVLPGKSLLLIFALYLLLVYIFATIGFFYFRPDYTPEAMANPNAPQRCSTLFLCFLSSFDLAFKSNGGLGGFLLPRALGTDPLATGRFLFDNAYNIILMVILLNITFGIIIDTFATIRTSHKERAEELRDRCFICSIDGYTFDRLTKRGFEYHTRLEHNMWHYLYLFVHINKKDYTEYNGIELYLAMKMAKNDVSFFPNHRAMALEKADPTLQLVPDDDQNESNKKPTATPVTLSEAKRANTDRKLDVLAKKEDPGTARLEKHLDALFEQHESLRERQKSIEDVQRQVLATQQAILALLNQTASPVKLQRKSEHFFPE